jgi:molybdopterin-guanine dinucleotide biosynthesis protein A
MGSDKLALAFGGETLLARCLRLVREAVDEVVLVAREGQALPGGLEALRDPAEGLGPLAGIAIGLEAIQSQRAFVAAADMPLLRPALVSRLLELAQGFDACVPMLDGFPVPTCAVYAKSLAARARSLVEARELRASALADDVRTRRVAPDELRDVDPELESFLDCDTPEEYAAALRRAGCAPGLTAARRS